MVRISIDHIYVNRYNESRRLFINITTIDSQQPAIEDPVLWILSSTISHSTRGNYIALQLTCNHPASTTVHCSYR
jgi:hypothetical protein